MELGLVILFSMLYTTAAVDWEIKAVMSNITNSPTNLAFTFYERGITSESDAPIVTKTISFNKGSPAVVNVNMPTITRPMKIDVMRDGTEDNILWKLLKVTMESSSHTFTFQCNCWMGTDSKSTLFPAEDMWAMQATTRGGIYDASFNNFGIILWDKSGVSQTGYFHGPFQKNENVILYMTIHLNDLEKYRIWSVERTDRWSYDKFAFIHIRTCRSFTFGSAVVKYLSITQVIQSIGSTPDCTTASITPTATVTATTTTTITTYPTITDAAKTTTSTSTTATNPTTSTTTATTDSTTNTVTVTTVTTNPTIPTTATNPTSSTTATTNPTTTATTTRTTTTTTATNPTSTTATATTTDSAITIPDTTITTSTDNGVPPSTKTLSTTTERLGNVTSDASTNATSQTVLPCCPCAPHKPAVNMTTAQLETIVKQLKAELSVNITTLSATIRKKTSAADDRTSSKAIGLLGVTFLAVPFVLIVVLDLRRLRQFIHS